MKIHMNTYINIHMENTMMLNEHSYNHNHFDEQFDKYLYDLIIHMKTLINYWSLPVSYIGHTFSIYYIS